MAVFGAAPLLTHPLSFTDEPCTSGEFLQELMSNFLVKIKEEQDAIAPTDDVPD
ncbi:hypothetical protein [Streptomyces sp. NBC_00057]|uniref:hypothetical protein n=1 Tax=Streptomyces sp. NBC_00057 TaxID=2975634 RepID=UPI0032481CA9